VSGVDYSVTLENISHSSFTERTIRKMYELIDDARTDVYLQNMARQIVRGCPSKDYICFGEKLLQAAKKLCTYVPDPQGIERIQDPWTTLALRTCDCDDFSILLCAWAQSLNFDCRLMTVMGVRDPKTGKVVERWSHVLPVMRVPDDEIWYGADAIIPESTFGWVPSEEFPRKIWER
jgi:hypothetical protein